MYMFLQSKKPGHRSGFTLVEIIIGTAIMALISGMMAHWFFMQRRYQQRVFAISDSQQSIRQASWNMIQELRTARTIISPKLNADKSIKSDNKVVFKNFAGDIVCFYFVAEKGEIRRCLIPNGPGAPAISPAAVGKGFSQVVFTAHDQGNRLVGIFLESNGTFGLESVYLLND